jgi:hypothetical protein
LLRIDKTVLVPWRIRATSLLLFLAAALELVA